jgi:hypothetical protein
MRRQLMRLRNSSDLVWGGCVLVVGGLAK